jgi:hypothetical protein
LCRKRKFTKIEKERSVSTNEAKKIEKNKNKNKENNTKKREE